MASEPDSVQETSSSVLTLEDGILVSRVKHNGQLLDLDEARCVSLALARLTGGRAAPLLVDVGPMHRQTKQARDYFSKDPEHLRCYTACALLVESPMARVLANFYMGINRPLRPTRMFTDRDLALEWLQQYK